MTITLTPVFTLWLQVDDKEVDYAYTNSGAGHSEGGAVHAVVILAQGQKVWLRSYQDSYYLDGPTAFSGFLIYHNFTWLTYFWLTWKMWVYVMISVRPAYRRPIVSTWQKLKPCNFFAHYKNDKRQTLHNDSTYWALIIYIFFSDLNCILWS